MAGTPTEVHDVHKRLVENRGLIPAGTHSVQKHGNSSYGVLPSKFCEYDEIGQGDQIETFVDYEIGAVIHIPRANLEGIDR